MLGIPLNFSPDIGHKRGGFSETLSEKGLEFILSKGGGPVALNLGLTLLPVEVEPIPKEQGCEGNTLEPCDTGRVKMVLALLTEIVALHMQGPII